MLGKNHTCHQRQPILALKITLTKWFRRPFFLDLLLTLIYCWLGAFCPIAINSPFGRHSPGANTTLSYTVCRARAGGSSARGSKAQAEQAMRQNSSRLRGYFQLNLVLLGFLQIPSWDWRHPTASYKTPNKKTECVSQLAEQPLATTC